MNSFFDLGYWAEDRFVGTITRIDVPATAQVLCDWLGTCLEEVAGWSQPPPKIHTEQLNSSKTQFRVGNLYRGELERWMGFSVADMSNGRSILSAACAQPLACADEYRHILAGVWQYWPDAKLISKQPKKVEDKKVWKAMFFELPIEREHFRTWFVEATTSLLTEAAPTFETPEGPVFLTARADSLDEGYHYINAHFEDVRGMTPIPSQPNWGDGVIQFNGRSYGPARLGVYAVCYRAELVPYFDELVALLRHRYPEPEQQAEQVAVNLGGRPRGTGLKVANTIDEIRKYNALSLTDAQIAQKLGITGGYVCQLRNRAGIPPATPPASMKKKVDVKT